MGALLLALLGLGLAFALVERRWPGVPAQRRWRQGTTTDLAYWFFTPLATRAVTRLALISAVILLAAAAGVPLDRAHVTAMAAGSGRLVQRQPRLLQVLEVLLLGFPPGVLAGYVPFLTLYALLLHANVSWDFGPLRLVLASPAFHRWHHTTEAEGLDKNFAGLFPFLDLGFGSLYLPRGRRPERFGLLGDVIPQSLWSQLAYPFRRRPAVS